MLYFTLLCFSVLPLFFRVGNVKLMTVTVIILVFFFYLTKFKLLRTYDNLLCMLYLLGYSKHHRPSKTIVIYLEPVSIHHYLTIFKADLKKVVT